MSRSPTAHRRRGPCQLSYATILPTHAFVTLKGTDVRAACSPVTVVVIEMTGTVKIVMRERVESERDSTLQYPEPVRIW